MKVIKKKLPEIIGAVRVTLLLLTLTSVIYSSQAHAGTSSAVAQAKATIGSVCNVSATNINFGVLNLQATNNINTANGTLMVQCTKKTSYSILMTFGTPATGAYYLNGKPLTGYMTGVNTGSHIAYSIQSAPINNSNAAQAWGGTPVSGTGTGIVQNYTMYGEVQLNAFGAPAYPVVDNYSDNVTATITF